MISSVNHANVFAVLTKIAPIIIFEMSSPDLRCVNLFNLIFNAFTHILIFLIPFFYVIDTLIARIGLIHVA